MIRPLLASLLILPLSLYSQDYNGYILKADNALDTKDYTMAGAFYDSAFLKGVGSSFDLYNAACVWSLSGNPQKAIQYLTKAFEAGYQNFDEMYYDKDLNNLREMEAYKSLEKRYKNDSSVYYFDIIKELYRNESAVFKSKRISLGEAFIEEYTPSEVIERAGLNVLVNETDTMFRFPGKTIEFHNCRFDDNGHGYNDLSKLAIKLVAFIDCRGNLSVSKMEVEHLLFYDQSEGIDFRYLKIHDVKQHGVFTLYAQGRQFQCSNSSFTIEIPPEGYLLLSEGVWADLDDSDGMKWNLNYETIDVDNTEIHNAEGVGPYDLVVEANRLKVVNVSIDNTFRLRGAVSETINIKENIFPSLIDLFNLRLPETTFYIPFDQFSKTEFVRLIERDESYALEIDKKSLFVDLTAMYKDFYDHYRDRADLVSANEVYVRLKELEIYYLKEKSGKNLEEWMRLWINQIMGVYTNHATSPGKAILVSMAIIIVFAIFYFLFPSDWDNRSKSQLIEDYRLFIEKNEHGYLKPFLKMTKGVVLSYLNALALSMNAFVTLGFGSIPTKGVARYVCIIQGVMGWFLLSLFTVALLNQVLL